MTLRSAVVVALIAGTALAQPEQDPPPLEDPALDLIAEELDSRGEGPPVGRTTGEVSIPARPGDPGSIEIPEMKGGPLMPEGTFLSRRTGVALTAPSGEHYFVFAGDDTPPPMIFLPCQTLARMAHFATDAESPALIVSGEVMTYRGRNYLLPTAFGVAPLADEQTETAEQTGDEPAPEAQDESNPDPLGADPRVEALLTDILERERVPRGLRPDAGAEPVEGAGPREGDLLIRRRGRMTRLAGGEWAFRFDNDSDAADTPLVILPCQMMVRLEAIGGDRGDEASIELSGRTYAFEGRRYVLPTLFRVLPDTDLDSLQ